MKCPFDHRNWSLQNLDDIASWIAHNEGNVLILNRNFIENTTESQSLASAMLMRMNDPFFQFFGKMATDEKASLGRHEVLERFKASAEFRRLVKKVHEEYSLDHDDDEMILRRIYGAHYPEVLDDRILPYADSVTALVKARAALPHLESSIKSNSIPYMEDVVRFTHEENNMDQSGDEQTLEELVHNDMLESILIQREVDEELEKEGSQNRQELEGGQGGETEEERSQRKVRARGDADRLLPTRRRNQDYFERNLTQVLDGTKAAMQEESLRTSYMTHLKLVIKHIIKHRIPKSDWPQFLQRFQLEQLMSVIEDVDPSPACPHPREIGFDMIRNGIPFVDRTGRALVIECNEGYTLHGPKEMFCDNGKWITRENRMPICVATGVISSPSNCDMPPPGLIPHGSLVPRGTTMRVECDPKYVLRGSPEIFCDRGRWMPASGNMPTCISNFRDVELCYSNPPESPVNGSVTEAHMLTSGKVVVRFMCNEGFGLHGADYAKCDFGTWAPLAPICVPNSKDEIPHNVEMPQTPVRCTALRIPHGRVHYYAEGPIYARLTCSAGYRLSGQPKIMCNDDGEWAAPKPSCVDLGRNDIYTQPTCPRLSAPLNGEVQYVTSTAARFLCNPGYRLDGRNDITCYQGRWSDVSPRCIRNVIGGCNPDEPVKGLNAIVFAYSDGRWFECQAGYELSGLKVQFCRNGVWDQEPICTAPPGSLWLNSTESRIYPAPECPLPPRTDDLIVVPRGSTVYYRCLRRDAQLVGPSSTECMGGHWTNPEPPVCLHRAPPPPAPASQTTRRPPPLGYASQHRCYPAKILGGDGYLFSEGRSIRYQCHTEYFIRGESTLQCENSRWSDRLPQCVPIEGHNWPLENGEIFLEGLRCRLPTSNSYSQLKLSERGRRVTYTCSNSQMTSDKICSSHGQWEGPMVDCGTKGVCEPQDILNGRFYQYGDDVGYIQCNHNFVLEYSPSRQRIQQVYCRQNSGVWDFGVRPPRCVPDQSPDNRPASEEVSINEPNNTRFLIDECPPPQVSSNYTWFIQGEGRRITLGCKGQPRKRSVGQLTCSSSGSWLHNVGSSSCREQVSSACSMGNQKIINGEYFVYDEKHYLFQCNKGYKLEGASMAVCPGYRPNYPKDIAELDSNFVLPRCVKNDNDYRPGTWEALDPSLDPHFEGRQCHWPIELANVSSSEYLISQGGRYVTFRCSGLDKKIFCENGQWHGDNLACLMRQHQHRGCGEVLPNEPRFGTYFQYQGSRNATRLYYFQCYTGYELLGQAIVPCTDSAPEEPECIPELDPSDRTLIKVRNPQPTVAVHCSVPPARIEGGYIAVQSFGDRVTIKCRPGYFLEGSTTSMKTITCTEERWSNNWPKCSLRGDVVSLRSPRYDPFGREIPQQLTGDKAALQNSLLRAQFLEHTRQMAEFRQGHNRHLRSQGVPPGMRIPLASYEEARRRTRRKNHPPTEETDDTENHPLDIPGSLKEFENDIKKYGLTQADVDVLKLMNNDLRSKFIEDRQKGIFKAKSDPAQSQKFLSQVFGTKVNSKPPVSNVIEQLKKHASEPLPTPHALEQHATPNHGTANTAITTAQKNGPHSKSPSSIEISSEHRSTTAEIDLTEATAKNATVVSTMNATGGADLGGSLKGNSLVRADVGNDNKGIGDIDKEDIAEDDYTSNSVAQTDVKTDSSETISDGNHEERPTTDTPRLVKEFQVKASNKTRKGYDTSCAHMDNQAPEIANGFVLSYELLEGTDSQMLRVTYRCDPDYMFKYEHTSSLLCRLGEWVGESPQCIPDDDKEEEEK
ncbi:hypothetical protein BIW11_06115 [Tropilaelaps mercedesae]|uniref:Sushi domain-containing protein n=1 Tax=Tropilaelaps mercedesae TaxID=418985 RepID=A0A1V9XZE8_9ACAR|nr:hypothetical protein BIW11_06115 [Tropilaelaps mercedesae]